MEQAIQLAPPSRLKRRLVLGAVAFGLLCALGIGTRFYKTGVNPEVKLPQHVSTKNVVLGKVLSAIRTMDVANARLEFAPGHYGGQVSGHTLGVEVGPNVYIDIRTLKLKFTPPPAVPLIDLADKKLPERTVMGLHWEEVDFSVNGLLLVSIDGYAPIRIEQVNLTSTAANMARVSVGDLFANLVSSLVAGTLDAPVSDDNHAQEDSRLRVASADIKTAIVALQPDLVLDLAKGVKIACGQRGGLVLTDVHYQLLPTESWRAKVNADLDIVAPTQFFSNHMQFNVGAGRLRMVLDVAMANDQLTVNTTQSPHNSGQLTIGKGSIKSLKQAWDCEMTDAEIGIDGLAYSGSRRHANSNLDVSASLQATSRVAWQFRGWQVAGQVVANQLNVSAVAGSTDGSPEHLLVASPQAVVIKEIALKKDLGGGTLEVTLPSGSVAWSFNKGLPTPSTLDLFHSGGGLVSYRGRDGLTVNAVFSAGATLTLPSGAEPGGPGDGDGFAVAGLVKTLQLITPKKETLQLNDMKLDVKSLPRPYQGITLACQGQAAWLSEAVSVDGAEVFVDGLTLWRGEDGKTHGNVAARLLIPKSEVARLVQAELTKPHVVHGGGIGKVLFFDGSVSDMQVNSSQLKTWFAGPKIHIEGPVSINGTLTTKRRMTVDIPLVGHKETTMTNHNDFGLTGKLRADATAVCPPAPDLASQKIEVHFEFERTMLALGGFVGKVPFAEDVMDGALKLFGIESKIKKALPSKVSIPLFKGAGYSHGSPWLTTVRNPRFAIGDHGDNLELRMTAELE